MAHKHCKIKCSTQICCSAPRGERGPRNYNDGISVGLPGNTGPGGPEGLQGATGPVGDTGPLQRSAFMISYSYFDAQSSTTVGSISWDSTDFNAGAAVRLLPFPDYFTISSGPAYFSWPFGGSFIIYNGPPGRYKVLINFQLINELDPALIVGIEDGFFSLNGVSGTSINFTASSIRDSTFTQKYDGVLETYVDLTNGQLITPQLQMNFIVAPEFGVYLNFFTLTFMEMP